MSGEASRNSLGGRPAQGEAESVAIHWFTSADDSELWQFATILKWRWEPEEGSYYDGQVKIPDDDVQLAKYIVSKYCPADEEPDLIILLSQESTTDIGLIMFNEQGRVIKNE
jgi:hypothetical protein